MTRRNWDSLSPAYQRRLSRNGITQHLYNSGHSLAVARGHAKTPEHPERAYKHPERYREYISKRRIGGGPTLPTRQQVIDRLTDMLARESRGGQLDKLDVTYVRDNVLAMTDSEFREASRINSLDELRDAVNRWNMENAPRAALNRQGSMSADQWLKFLNTAVSRQNLANPFWYH